MILESWNLTQPFKPCRGRTSLNSRLLIFKALVQAGRGGLQPTALAAELQLPANTLSSI
jgi:hypothetical protein